MATANPAWFEQADAVGVINSRELRVQLVGPSAILSGDERRSLRVRPIVVGARCAGAPLAMLLARQGTRVPLVDRATFPSDIPHGHFIHRHETNIAEARFTFPRPEILALRAALREKPHEATRFLKARMGMIDPQSFFNPENMQRLMTRGQVETTGH